MTCAWRMKAMCVLVPADMARWDCAYWTGTGASVLTGR